MADEKKDETPAFDVAVLGAPTDDGEGRRILRVKPGEAQIGEVRPVKEGKPLAPSGEIVSLKPRADVPGLHDVEVKYKAEDADPRSERKGPAKVATNAYRESWDRIFGPAKKPSSSDVN